MNVERVNALVREFPPSVAAEVREFASRPQDEQLVYLFMELRDARTKVAALSLSKPMRERLMEYGALGSIVAYVLFDRKDQIGPWFGGQ